MDRDGWGQETNVREEGTREELGQGCWKVYSGGTGEETRGRDEGMERNQDRKTETARASVGGWAGKEEETCGRGKGTGEEPN